MTPVQDDSLATGIDIIDRKLNGGIPLGSVVAISASPESQSELFLYDLATTRETVYLSTVRTVNTVDAALDAQAIDPETVETIRADPQSPLESATAIIEELPSGTNLIIDPVVPLEECSAGRYRQFLADLKQRAVEHGHVVILHCLRDPTPDRRQDTVHVADVVFSLATETEGQSVVTRLTIPKFRGRQSVEDVIKLDLTSEVEVDVSRNIA